MPQTRPLLAAESSSESEPEGSTPTARVPTPKRACTALAKSALHDAERKCMGPLQLAEHRSQKYAAQLSVSDIDGEEFKRDLNALRDKLSEAPVPDEDLLGMCRIASQMAKRPLSAGFAMHQFASLAKAMEKTEEEALPACEEVELAKQARATMLTTGVTRVRQQGGTAEEASLHRKLAHWKRRKGTHAASMRFVLRSNPQWLAWFDAFVAGDLRAKKADSAAKVNALLLAGHAHPHEPTFEGQKPWPCGSPGSEAKRVYNAMTKLREYMREGRATQARVDACLAGLAAKWPARDAWWREGFVAPDFVPARQAEVNARLLAGWAHPQEPAFEGWKKWPRGASGSEADKLYHAMFNLRANIREGGASTAHVDGCLAGLAAKWPARAAWWRGVAE